MTAFPLTLPFGAGENGGWGRAGLLLGDSERMGSSQEVSRPLTNMGFRGTDLPTPEQPKIQA